MDPLRQLIFPLHAAVSISEARVVAPSGASESLQDGGEAVHEEAVLAPGAPQASVGVLSTGDADAERLGRERQVEYEAKRRMLADYIRENHSDFLNTSHLTLGQQLSYLVLKLLMNRVDVKSEYAIAISSDDIRRLVFVIGSLVSVLLKSDVDKDQSCIISERVAIAEIQRICGDQSILMTTWFYFFSHKEFFDKTIFSICGMVAPHVTPYRFLLPLAFMYDMLVDMCSACGDEPPSHSDLEVCLRCWALPLSLRRKGQMNRLIDEDLIKKRKANEPQNHPDLTARYCKSLFFVSSMKPQDLWCSIENEMKNVGHNQQFLLMDMETRFENVKIPLLDGILEVLPTDEEFHAECPDADLSNLQACRKDLALCSSWAHLELQVKRVAFRLLESTLHTYHVELQNERQNLIMQILQKHNLVNPIITACSLRQVLCVFMRELIMRVLGKLPVGDSRLSMTLVERKNVLFYVKNIIEFISKVNPKEPQKIDALIEVSCSVLKQKFQDESPFLFDLLLLLKCQESFDQCISSMCQQTGSPVSPSELLVYLMSNMIGMYNMFPPVKAIECTDSSSFVTLVIGCLNIDRLSMSQARVRQMKKMAKEWSKFATDGHTLVWMRFEKLSNSILQNEVLEIQDAVCTIRELGKELKEKRMSLCEKTHEYLTKILDFLPNEDVFKQEYPDKKASDAVKRLSFSLVEDHRRYVKDVQGVITFVKSLTPPVFDLFDRDMQAISSLMLKSLSVAMSESLPGSKCDSEECLEADILELNEILSGLTLESSVQASQGEKKGGRKSKSPPPCAVAPLPPPGASADEDDDVVEVICPVAVASSSSRLLEFFDREIQKRPPHDVPSVFPKFARLHKNFMGTMGGRLSPIIGLDAQQHVNVGPMRIRMNGLCNHLYLESCGFDILGKLQRAQRMDLMSAIVPTWMADRYLVAELQGDVQLLACGNAYPVVHSLSALKGVLSGESELPVYLSEYIDQLSKGLVWYRYGRESQSIEHLQESSEWRWLDVCNTLALQDRSMTQDQEREFVAFVAQKHQHSYELMYHSLAASSSDKGLLDIASLFRPYLDQWKMTQQEAAQSPTLCAASPIVLDMNRLIEAAKRMYESQVKKHASRKMTQMMRELVLHLTRFKHTIDVSELFPETHLWPYYYRNMLNIQWIIEGVYKIACSYHNLKDCKSHKFRDYEILLDSVPSSRLLPPLDVFSEYNLGVHVHYEAFPVSDFLGNTCLREYQAILEQGSRAALDGADYVTQDKKAVDAQGCFRQRVGFLVHSLSERLLPVFDRLMR